MLGSRVIVSSAGSYAPASDSAPSSPFLRTTLPTLVLVLSFKFLTFLRILFISGLVSVSITVSTKVSTFPLSIALAILLATSSNVASCSVVSFGSSTFSTGRFNFLSFLAILANTSGSSVLSASSSKASISLWLDSAIRSSTVNSFVVS